jgi:chromate transporter
LAVFFLKVGALLYGGGYVLIAYLQHGLVGEYGLVGEHGQLNEQVLLDAVAVGQITPGPLLSTVTFIGYWLLGWPGACVATVAVLLPSLVFVTAASPWIPRLRRLWWTGLVLDAVSAAAVGLTLAVALRLGWAVLVDWASCLLTAATIAVGLWWTSRPRRPTSPPTESLHAATQNVRGSQR